MSSDQSFEVEPHLRPASHEQPPNKAELIEMAFEYMRAGSTINHAALQCGYSPATFWRWLHESSDLVARYEQLKVERSRALIEHVIYEMQAATSLEQVKCAERRAKYYMLIAAKLNPKEFSDRMHSPVLAKSLGSGRVSFVLNIGQQPTHHKGELTVIEQPEDGE